MTITKDDLAGLDTPLAVATHVRNFLAQQGEPSLDGDLQCRYRTPLPHGRVLACAAGCLITDDNYYEGTEGLTVGHSGVVAAIEASLGRSLDGDEWDLIALLQEAHDDDCARRPFQQTLHAIDDIIAEFYTDTESETP